MSGEPQDKQTDQPRKLTRTDLLAAINTISIVLGIVLGLAHLKEISRHSEDVSRFLRISSIQYLEEFTDGADASQADLSAVLVDVEMLTADVRERIEAGEPGHEIYYSDSFKAYRSVCSFWERSSVFVDLGYFEFDVIYNLKAYPYVFSEKTAEIRALIGKHWYGKDRPLVDFLTGMDSLKERYEKEDSKG